MRTSKHDLLSAIAEDENIKHICTEEKTDASENGKGKHHRDKEQAKSEGDPQDEEEPGTEPESSAEEDESIEEQEEEQPQTRFKKGSSADAMFMDWTIDNASEYVEDKPKDMC